MRSDDDAFLELLLAEPEIAVWLDPDDRDDDTDAPTPIQPWRNVDVRAPHPT